MTTPSANEEPILNAFHAFKKKNLVAPTVPTLQTEASLFIAAQTNILLNQALEHSLELSEFKLTPEIKQQMADFDSQQFQRMQSLLVEGKNLSLGNVTHSVTDKVNTRPAT